MTRHPPPKSPYFTCYCPDCELARMYWRKKAALMLLTGIAALFAFGYLWSIAR